MWLEESILRGLVGSILEGLGNQFLCPGSPIVLILSQGFGKPEKGNSGDKGSSGKDSCKGGAGSRGCGGGGGGGGGLSSGGGPGCGPGGRGRGDGPAGSGGPGARKRKAVADQELKVEPAEVCTAPTMTAPAVTPTDSSAASSSAKHDRGITLALGASQMATELPLSMQTKQMMNQSASQLTTT